MPVTVSMPLLLIPVVAYLLGSIPFGLLLAQLFAGKDVRRTGSGNIGATNVARVVSPLAGILTLVLDAAKGASAVWIAARLANDSAVWMMTAALMVFLGHCYPVWLKFKGGKGVATAAGIFLMLCPSACLAAIALFVLVVCVYRYVSLGSIVTAGAMPLLIYLLWAPRHAPPLGINVGTLAISLLVIYRHDANIQRLVQGDEPRFLFKRDENRND